MIQNRLTFDHIGIIVPDLSIGEKEICNILPIVNRSKEYIDELIIVKIRFLTDRSGIKYELIAPLNDNSPLSSVLKTKKDVINHVAYKTDTFDEALVYFNKLGCFQLGQPTPAIAFNYKKVVFFITKLGAIIEIIEN